MRVELGRGNLVIAPLSRPLASATVTSATPTLQREADRLLERLSDSVSRLESLRTITAPRRGAISSVIATSRVLGVTVATPATLTSTEEVNTDLTGFYPTDPAWNGLSLPSLGVGGVYDGAQGTDTLTATVTRVNGSGNVVIEIEDSSGGSVDTLRIGDGERDVPQSLSNGLQVTVGQGLMIIGDSFEIEVEDTPQAVDPDAAFDGSTGRVNFERGFAVGTGSFTVNGQVVTVNADDTVNAVLARIQSETGIIASFDAANETVVLTQNTLGATPTITVGNDSSGFLDAVKLTGATPVPGSDSTSLADQPMHTVGAFIGVTSGQISVNGVELTIDVSTDSVNDVLAAITASVPGVFAQYWTQSDTVTLRSTTGSLDLDEGTTGFFSALDVASTRGTELAPRVRLLAADRRELANGLTRVLRDLNAVADLNSRHSGLLGGLVAAVDALIGASSDGERSDRIGLRLRPGGRLYDVNNNAIRRIDRRLADDPQAAVDALFGVEGDPGVVASLRTNIEAAARIQSAGLGFA